MTPPTDLKSAPLDPERVIHGVIGRLRAALIVLFADAGAPADKPQEVSRRYGLNKNLTWKIARILRSTDPYEAVGLLPGSEGMELLLKGLQPHAKGQSAVEEVRAAYNAARSALGGVVKDRGELEVFIDGMRADSDLTQARRLAFRGNSGVYGVQARLRLATQFIFPNRDKPDWIDAIVAAGVLGIRRLRPNVMYPLYRSSVTADQTGTAPRTTGKFPLNDDAGDGSDPAAWLLDEYSTISPEELHQTAGDQSSQLALAAGPIGRAAERDLIFGSRFRAMGRHVATEPDEQLELATAISLPSECTLVDAFVHRSFCRDHDATADIYITANGPLPKAGPRRASHRLPIELRVLPLTCTRTSVATTHMREYPDLVAMLASKTGYPADEFRGFRIELEYPPVPSDILLCYPMPQPQ